MINFFGILKQTAKLFGASILSSVIFAGLKNNIPGGKTLLSILLLLASLILFLYIYKTICFSLHIRSESLFDYIIYSVIPFAFYAVVSILLYFFRLSEISIWLFLPARFLEPFLPKSYEYAIISFIVNYLLMLLTIARFPLKYYFRRSSVLSEKMLAEEEEARLREQISHKN